MQTAGVSKSFLYNNVKIRDLINALRAPGKTVSADIADESTEAVIIALKLEIRRLNDEIHKLKQESLWKEKYIKTREENAVLRDRIEKLMGKIYSSK